MSTDAPDYALTLIAMGCYMAVFLQAACHSLHSHPDRLQLLEAQKTKADLDLVLEKLQQQIADQEEVPALKN